MAAFHYPYPSKLAQKATSGQFLHSWRMTGFNLQTAISRLDGIVLEIGGPSDSGYYFLDGVVFNSPAIITNIHADALPFAPNKSELNTHIEQLIDGRHLPYIDNSLSVVLAAHLPLVDDTKYDFAALTLNEERAISREIAQAEAAEKHIAHTGELDDRAFVVSLRLAVAREVYRALQPGGLYLTDGTSDQVKALQAIGFTKLAEIDVNQFDSELVGAAPYYELVLQKK